MPDLLHERIAHGAREATRLRSEVSDAFNHRDKSPQARRAWAEACSRWHAHTSAHSLLWLDEVLLKLEAGDQEVLTLAVAYLEVNPFEFRSGYLKTRLIRRLKRTPMPEEMRRRLRVAILCALEAHRGDGWSEFCRLGVAVANDEFRQKLLERIQDSRELSARRAAKALAFLDRSKGR